MNKINKILLTISIILFFATIIISQGNVENVIYPTNSIYDKSLIDTLNNLSGLVPPDETIVTSDKSPYLVYFTKHYATAPWTAEYNKDILDANVNTTVDILTDYMKRKNYRYLVVFEGQSQVEYYGKLFSTEGLHQLDDNFIEIANYATDFSKIHLYSMRGV